MHQPLDWNLVLYGSDVREVSRCMPTKWLEQIKE